MAYALVNPYCTLGELVEELKMDAKEVSAGKSTDFTARADDNTLSLDSHGFINGEVVTVSGIGSSTGLTINTDYYVVNATENALQLAATEGGPAVNITADGTVTIFDSSFEDELKRAIYNASRWVDDYMRRDFVLHDHSVTPKTYHQFSEGVYRNKIFLPSQPVIEITEVKEGDAVLETDEYLTDAVLGILYRAAGVWRPLAPDGLVSIKGKFGYLQDTTTSVPTGIPGHISHATRLVAAAFSNHNRKQVSGLDGQATQIQDNAIPKTVFDVLGKRSPILLS